MINRGVIFDRGFRGRGGPTWEYDHHLSV